MTVWENRIMSQMQKSYKGHDKYNAPLWFVNTRHAVYFILGVIEVLLVFRFIFKLLGANPQNGFVAFLYTVSGIFAAPFSGIFNSFVSSGLASKSVFEPAAIIGMIVYAVIAWGIISLVRIKANNRE
jgi:hypothetical protein